ncbi:DUF397 domain-containing protein [Streptomyces yaizuensis]|uniref:DUF397 domain-containing protein n=1 Tax=Streptomyces yaizuensis TaxID=2989713 RepID=A0AA86J3A8_9ACTN|nr:DUF397 domain-containing protein [Streptomyces sp. YSPA8]BDT39662.1 DUF397 domain-containing protein [Streptomyces sp. YSPA8]
MSQTRPPVPALENLRWFKATASSESGACVEVAKVPHEWVALRDSKENGGPVVTVATGAFEMFIAGVQSGRF